MMERITGTEYVVESECMTTDRSHNVKKLAQSVNFMPTEDKLGYQDQTDDEDCEMNVTFEGDEFRNVNRANLPYQLSKSINKSKKSHHK